MSTWPAPTGRPLAVQVFGGMLDCTIQRLVGTHLVDMNDGIYEYRYTPQEYIAIYVGPRSEWVRR